MSYVINGDKGYVYVREEIANFAIEMEKEMKKKDNKYNDTHRSNMKFLIDHLKEEREEVDSELYLLDKKDSLYNSVVDIIINDLKTELVHEAIMAMLVSDAVVSDAVEASK